MRTRLHIFAAALVPVAAAGAAVVALFSPPQLPAQPTAGAATAPALSQTNAVPVVQTNAVPAKVDQSPPQKPKVKHQITGAELYSIHCNRCHPERYPTERTAAQWKTIMLHMQVRANLPASQAKLILKYLQENSGR